jgi:DNA repair photolyase
MVAPVIPGLTDHEIPAILAAAAQRGASRAGWQLLRLPYGVKELFDAWLARWRPDAREKVLGRLRELHGGRLNDASFGKRMRGEGPYAGQLEALFRVSRAKLGLDGRRFDLDASSFRRPERPRQLALGFAPAPAPAATPPRPRRDL